MTDERRRAKALDEALRGGAADDETRPLTETAERLRDALATDVPPAERQRALFLSGVSTRDRARFSPVRVLVPAMGVAVLVFAAIAGTHALPGERLYPFREAMNAVGIGETPVSEFEDYLFTATRMIKRADLALDDDPDRAILLAVRAIEECGRGRELVPELSNREERLESIEDLEERAVEIIAEASESDESEDEGSDDADDNSGSGSDDSGDDDSSGPGSGDSGGDDSSGSGSDDSDGDDSSGSGSGDSGGDDSSGSGSGGSGDSSGSGGGDSGGDSSGSGSDGSGSDDFSGSGGDD